MELNIEDETAHWAQGYIHPDIDNADLRQWGWKPPQDLKELTAHKAEFIRLWNQGVDVFQRYHQGFKHNEGNRPGISVIRQDLRQDMRFMESHKAILKMTEKRMDWISSIFRAEAREAERHYEDRMAEIARLREEERQRELKDLEAMPNFGMF